MAAAGSEELKWLYLAPSGPGDTPSSPTLPLVTAEPPVVVPLPNYDTDRDSSPGLLIKKDAEGLVGGDPTKVQVFSRTVGELVRVEDGSSRLQVSVAAKDFARKDVHVVYAVDRCPPAGGCTKLGQDDRVVGSADRWKKATLTVSDIEATFEPGGRLEIRIAFLDGGEDDGWLAFGTDDHDGHHLFEVDE